MDATNWPLLMAGSVVMMLPVLMVLFLAQRALWPAAERGWGAEARSDLTPGNLTRSTTTWLTPVRHPRRSSVLALALWPGGAGAQAPADRISFMVFGDAAERAAYERLVAGFTQRHPQVQIALVHVPGQGDYRKRLGVDFAAGTPADIVLLNYRRYAAFAAKGVARAPRTLPGAQHGDPGADFYPQAMEPFRWHGTLMCIPQNLSSLVVYYNRDLFDRAGVSRPTDDWTWDDFLHAARALTRDTKGSGRIDQYGLGTEVSLFRLAPFVWQNGGELVDRTAAPTRLALDSPAAREAVQWFVELQTRHRVVPDRSRRRPRAARAAS